MHEITKGALSVVMMQVIYFSDLYMSRCPQRFACTNNMQKQASDLQTVTSQGKYKEQQVWWQEQQIFLASQ